MGAIQADRQVLLDPRVVPTRQRHVRHVAVCRHRDPTGGGPTGACNQSAIGAEDPNRLDLSRGKKRGERCAQRLAARRAQSSRQVSGRQLSRDRCAHQRTVRIRRGLQASRRDLRAHDGRQAQAGNDGQRHARSAGDHQQRWSGAPRAARSWADYTCHARTMTAALRGCTRLHVYPAPYLCSRLEYAVSGLCSFARPRAMLKNSRCHHNAYFS